MAEKQKTEEIIRLEHVSKTFGSQTVLRDVTFDVKRGETFAIVGPSGCGKSVTLKIIIGLLRADEGRTWILGEEITQATESQLDRLRHRMAMVFQGGALFDSLTVGENVSFVLDQHSDLPEDEKAAIVAKNLGRVGLPGIEAKMPSELSGGMRKRVALARALALEPDIILFDEPTTGLDPIMTTEIGLLIRDLRNEVQTTAVMVSHDIKNTFLIADRVGVHHEGRLIDLGTPDQIRASKHPFVRQFLEGAPSAPAGETV